MISTGTRLVLGLSAAAAVAASGSAMTAANTGLIEHEAGFQQAAVSGVDIKNTAYSQNTTDPRLVDTIVFTLADGEEDIPDENYLQVLTVYKTTNAQAGPTTGNTTQYGEADPMNGTGQVCDFVAPNITCTTTGLLLADIYGISLAVTPHTVVDASPAPHPSTTPSPS